MIWTALSVVLTPCPPGPEARQTVISKSSGLIAISTSSASGNTATVQVLVANTAPACGRNSLNPVNATFILQPLVNVGIGYFKDNFFEPAQIRGARIEIFKLPALAFAAQRAHSVKVCVRQQRRFLPTRACANFKIVFPANPRQPVKNFAGFASASRFSSASRLGVRLPSAPVLNRQVLLPGRLRLSARVSATRKYAWPCVFSSLSRAYSGHPGALWIIKGLRIA